MIGFFCFAICCKAVIVLQNGIKLIEICLGKKYSAQIYYTYFSIATLDDHMKNFHHGPREHLTNTRLVPLESRRAALPTYYKSEASKPPESASYL